MANKLPKLDEIQGLFEMLLGRDVTVKPGKKLASRDCQFVADFVRKDGELGAVWGTDVSAASFIGAALSMIPAGRAKDAIKDKEVDGVLRENLYEVVNVLSSLFNKDDCDHVRLSEMSTEPSDATGDVLKKPASRLDFHVDVAGYGGGTMALFLS